MIFFLANVEFRACPVEGRKTIAELSSARKRDLSRNVAQAARLVGKPRQRASQGLGDDDERSESRRLFRFIHFLVIVYTKAGVAFVAMKENIRIEGKRDIQTKVMTTLFALFAEVERNLISERTREDLAQAGASGRKLGRPKGSLGVSRLDGKEDDIRRFLEPGVSKTAIAKLTGVSRTTLYSFMRPRGLKPSPLRVFLRESGRYPKLMELSQAMANDWSGFMRAVEEP